MVKIPHPPFRCSSHFCSFTHTYTHRFTNHSKADSSSRDNRVFYNLFVTLGYKQHRTVTYNMHKVHPSITMITILWVINLRNIFCSEKGSQFGWQPYWLLISCCKGYNVRGHVWAALSEALILDRSIDSQKSLGLTR